MDSFRSSPDGVGLVPHRWKPGSGAVSVLVIRLHPKNAVNAADFEPYLEGLQIQIADRSFGDPKGVDPGHALGTAVYDPTDPNSTIVQHEDIIGPTTVATAAIEVPDPLPFNEYLNPDLRLTVTRTTGGNPPQIVVVKDVNFNVDIMSGSLPATNTWDLYAALTPVALYVALPPPLVGLPPGTAYLDIPADGSALPFAAVLGAMQTVVAADPGGAVDLTALTPAQCQHIAWEIVSNRTLDPLPDPGPLENLYRKPGDDATARRNFESDLLTYYAVHSTRAEVLAKFVYAVSAALACQVTTQNATKVGLTIPVFPGLDFPSGAIPQVSVVISQ